ncbi:hypothetical protein ACFQZ4_41575 [Catellatospora coxensis]
MGRPRASPRRRPPDVKIAVLGQPVRSGPASRPETAIFERDPRTFDRRDGIRCLLMNVDPVLRALIRNPSAPEELLRRIVERADPSVSRHIGFHRDLPLSLIDTMAHHPAPEVRRAVLGVRNAPRKRSPCWPATRTPRCAWRCSAGPTSTCRSPRPPGARSPRTRAVSYDRRSSTSRTCPRPSSCCSPTTPSSVTSSCSATARRPTRTPSTSASSPQATRHRSWWRRRPPAAPRLRR